MSTRSATTQVELSASLPRELSIRSAGCGQWHDAGPIVICRRRWLMRLGVACVICLLGFAVSDAPAWAQEQLASSKASEPSVPVVKQSARDLSLERLNLPVSVDFDEVPLERALQEIAEQADVRLFYARHEDMDGRRVTLDLQDVTALAALYEVIRGQSLSMFITPSGHLIVGIDASAGQREAPSPEAPEQATGAIAGRITGEAAQPLPGVNVVIVGSVQGASTDLDGQYVITGVEPGTYAVEASSIGYQAQRTEGVRVVDGETTRVDFVLEEASVELGEIVAIGYGMKRSEDVTGSVSVVDAEILSAMPIASPDQALMGQIPGVQITSSTGLPGAGPKVQVRGHSNVGAGGMPLYVVDGFALPQPLDEEAARLRNPLADIPPSDIESITVLKDASATAIYGSRASNGVVVIQTKGGRSGASEVNISASTGFQRDVEWMTPALANARQYVEFENFIWQDRVRTGRAAEVPEMFRNPEQYSDGDGTDWLEVIQRDNAPMYNVQGSISGGSDALRSYVSAGVMRQEGIIWNTSFTRFNFRANVDAHLSQKINVGVSLAPSYTLRKQPNQQEERGGAIANAMRTCPLSPSHDEAGNVIPFPSTAINGGNGCPGALRMPNALYGLETVTNDYAGVRAIGTAFLSYSIARGVTARSSVNVDWGTLEREFFSPSSFGRRNTPPPVIPTGELETGRDLSWLSETTVNWVAQIGPGNLDAIGGFTAQTGSNFSTIFSGEFPNDEIRTLNVASNLDGSSVEEKWSMLSVLGRANYSLLGRYVFTGTVRADGSSRFGSDHRWGVFPSGALAWNVHNEPFMERLRRDIPQLKLRVSYGVTGNNQIGNYAALGVVGRDDYLFGDLVIGGSRLVSLANDVLGWESTREWNAGVDAALFDYRVQITADAYSRTTDNLLLPRVLPWSSGYRIVMENFGEVRNRGIEVGVTTHNVNREKFTWTTRLNGSLNRNKVLSLPGGVPIFSGGAEGFPTHITAVGRPVGMMIGYVVEGIYQSEEDIARYPSFPGAIPGNLRWRDANGDGRLTPGPIERGGDFVVIGDPHPDLTYGITNTLRYGPFEARILISGRIGGDVARLAHFRENRNLDGQLTVAADYVENFWRSPDNPGDGRTPTPLGSAEARRRYRGMHSEVIADGSNLWVRNAMLRYRLPAGLAGVKGSSIYVSVLNPFIITTYPGNPEAERNNRAGSLELGLDRFAYPIARQFTLGVELSL